MPLGFAKAILGQTAVAGGDVGYWHQATAVNTGTPGNVCQEVTLGSANTDTAFTFACWFRFFSRTSGNDSSNVDDFDPDFQETELFRLGGGSSGSLIVSFHENNGVQAMCFGISEGGGTTFSTGSLSSNFRTDYCDDEWHHILVQARFGTSTAQSKIYLDGVDKTTNSLGDTISLAGGVDHGAVMTFAGRSEDQVGTSSSTDHYKENTGDITQVYLELGSTTNNIGNIDRFYDSGYVDMGTDGNDSGADTPEVFLYVNSTPAVVNGGSTGTLAASTTNTMTVSATGGPS